MLARVLGAKVAAPGLDDTMAFGRLPRGDEVDCAVADEISPAHLFQRFTQQWPVVGVVVAKKGLV